MKRKGLVLLVGAVLLVGGYAIYDYRQEQTAQIKKSEGSLLSDQKEDQISYFLMQSSKINVEAKKENDSWLLLQPARDSANQIGCKEFLHGMVTEKYIQVVKEGDKIDVSAYGLDRPSGVIILKSAEKEEKFEVGSIKNFEGNSYIRKNGENKIFLASSTWFGKLEKKIGDFRDLRLMRMPNSQVNKLTFQKGSSQFSLTRRDGQWLNMERLKDRVDQNKVREILGMLNNTEALDVMEKGSVEKPVLKLTAGFEKGKSWVALFAPGKDVSYLVETNEPHFVFKLSPVDGQKFLLADFDSFRDRKEPFQLNRDKIKKITFSGKEIPFDEEILRRIEKLMVTSFVSDKNLLKDSVSQELLLKAEDGSVVFSLKWGQPRKTLVAGSETSVVLARSSAVDYAFYITEQEINALKLNQHEK